MGTSIITPKEHFQKGVKALCSWILFHWLALMLPACQEPAVDPPLPAPPDSTELIRAAVANAKVCARCHPTHYQQWRSSMHAYALIDPIFLALQRIAQQRSGNTLDQFCVKCHSPLGSMLKETPANFTLANLSEIAKQGVTCDACHRIKSFQPGRGIATINLDRQRRGSLANPQTNNYHGSTLDNRYNFSHICSPCHDIQSPNLTFKLEETNSEWNQSPYQVMGIECQNCHMPTDTAQVAINGPLRADFHDHRFIGVDYPLIDFPDKATTLQLIDQLLKNAVTMTVSLDSIAQVNRPLQIKVNIKNDKTGHHIPSGSIFERQMWLEVLVRDPQTHTLYFGSGLLDDNGDLRDHHSEFVVNQQIPPDSSLTLFNGSPYDQQGKETLFFWEARSIQKNTIAPFKSHTAIYRITPPSSAATLNISVRLRFRSFPPYFLRAIGKAELVQALRIFDMAVFNEHVQVSRP